MSTNKAEVMQTLVGMITEVLGDEDLGIEAGTGFRDGLAFKSIEFVALAELIQERWVDINFVAWLTGKPMPEILELKVGDVADFIVSSS